MSHNAIQEAAVIGVYDVQRGEVPKAFVILKDGHQLDAESLHQFVNERVYDWKQLRGGIVFVDEFPRTAMGKIRKSELK